MRWWGDNGAGKTNVIDAVYYLSMCKSSLPMTDGQSIRHGADFFLIEGTYATDAGKREVIVCSYSRKGGKVLKRNGKEYDRLFGPRGADSRGHRLAGRQCADLRSRRRTPPLPQRLPFAAGPPLPAGRHALQRRLAERYRLLKMQPDETMLEIYDRQLCDHAA